MYVLVHGAGMGASCWDRLIPHLDAPAVAVDLPGRGSRSNVPIESVTLEDCADALRETLRDIESDDIVMVAHSFAGVTVPRVMAEFAPRLRHVAFLSAVVPPDGTSVLDQIDPSVREAVRASITGGIYSQERQGAQMMLCNDLEPRSHRMDPRPGGRRLRGPAHRDGGSGRPHGRGPAHLHPADQGRLLSTRAAGTFGQPSSAAMSHTWTPATWRWLPPLSAWLRPSAS